jgi:hypothetical protein
MPGGPFYGTWGVGCHRKLKLWRYPGVPIPRRLRDRYRAA